MALSLVSDITATQTTFDVAGADPLTEGELRTIDSEHVLIRTAVPATLAFGESARQRLTVYRGAVGSAKAAHSAAATLTATVFGTGGGVTVDNQVDEPAEVTTLVVPGATISGDEADLSAISGLQTIRRLGPYRVNFDDTDAGVSIIGSEVGKVRVGDPIAADTVIVAAWPVLVTNFNNLGTDPFLTLDLYGPHASGADTPGVFGENIFQIDPSAGAYGDEGGPSGYGVGIAQGPGAGRWEKGPMPVICYDEVTLVAKWGGTDPGTPSQGAVDIYALIAEPAA